jgi:histone H4
METGKKIATTAPKRHRVVHRGTLEGITTPSLKRMARRGGVKRLSKTCYGMSRIMLESFLKKLMTDACAYTEHSNRKTLTALDVVHASKRQGQTMYGFDA